MNTKEAQSIINKNVATIETLSVTIRALHINKKQMTLAVFRQLPVFQAYKADGTLTDGIIIWGRVLYDIDSIKHWAVIESDGKLFRACVFFNTKVAGRRWHGNINNNDYTYTYGNDLDFSRAITDNIRQIEEVNRRIDYLQRCRNMANEYNNLVNYYNEKIETLRGIHYSGGDYALSKMAEKYNISRLHINKYIEEDTSIEEKEEFIRTLNARHEILQAAQISCRQINSYDQLFIAV